MSRLVRRLFSRVFDAPRPAPKVYRAADLRARLMLQALEGRAVPATFNVTNANDAGAGSLRQAIADANAAAGADTVAFDTNFFAPIALTNVLLPLLRKSTAGRIVNLSSILGSLTLHADPASPIYQAKSFAYDASKTALNAFTVHLAYELRDTPIKVNSAHPGWVKTDMGGDSAPMEIEDGSKTSVALATLPADGPTGGFFHLGQPLPW